MSRGWGEACVGVEDACDAAGDRVFGVQCSGGEACACPVWRVRVEAGLRFSEEAPADADRPPRTFDGQTWCVTGSFEHFKPRELAMEEVKNRGGRVTSNVTSKTTHLLAGPGAGSKLDRARKLGVRVVEEAEFLKLIRHP